MDFEKLIFYKGEIYSAYAEKYKRIHNQSLVAEGLFETIKLRKKQVLFAEEHFARMLNGLLRMNFAIPNNFTFENFLKDIAASTIENNIETARVKFVVFRNRDTSFESYVEVMPLQEYPFDKITLNLGFFEQERISSGILSAYKLNRYEPYRQAAAYAKVANVDDVVILNEAGNICETAIANIFIVTEGQIITPALSQGCVDGIFRRFLLNILPFNGFSIQESSITKRELMEAEEVFTTNCIRNILRVGSIGQKKYASTLIEKIYALIKTTYPHLL